MYARPARFEVHHPEHAHVIKNRRNECGLCNGDVVATEDVHHDEHRSAHDRRQYLPAGRCSRLDSAGECRLVTGSLHGGNRKRSGRHDIGHGTTVQRSEERAADDRNLGCAAAGPAGQADGQVHEHLAAARRLHESAEQNEYEHVSDANAHGRSEDRVEAVDVTDHAVDGEAGMTEDPWEDRTPERIAYKH